MVYPNFEKFALLNQGNTKQTTNTIMTETTTFEIPNAIVTIDDDDKLLVKLVKEVQNDN